MKDKKRPYRPIPPGEILKEELETRGWTQGDFAEITGRPLQAVNEIISGKKAITPETAVVFSEALGTSPEFWLNLESAYRLDLLYHEQHRAELVSRKAKLFTIAPVKELIKRGWIKPTNSIDQLESEVLEFLGTPDLDTFPSIAANFRKSGVGVIDTPALMAWIRKAEIEARKISCTPFVLKKFKETIRSLSKNSVSEIGIKRIPQKLRRLGVRLVFVRHLTQTRVDGAAFWLNRKSPVIALSLRMDRIDNFWFTLMHEIAHVLEGAKNNVNYIDRDITEEPGNNVERKANQYACDLLIPSDSFIEFVNQTMPFFSRKAVISFAEELGIHPSIIVGRLQYEKLIPYTNLRNLMTKVRPIFAECANT